VTVSQSSILVIVTTSGVLFDMKMESATKAWRPVGAGEASCPVADVHVQSEQRCSKLREVREPTKPPWLGDVTLIPWLGLE
jgi:hypothetical protein